MANNVTMIKQLEENITAEKKAIERLNDTIIKNQKIMSSFDSNTLPKLLTAKQHAMKQLATHKSKQSSFSWILNFIGLGKYTDVGKCQITINSCEKNINKQQNLWTQTEKLKREVSELEKDIKQLNTKIEKAKGTYFEQLSHKAENFLYKKPSLKDQINVELEKIEKKAPNDSRKAIINHLEEIKEQINQAAPNYTTIVHHRTELGHLLPPDNFSKLDTKLNTFITKNSPVPISSKKIEQSPTPDVNNASTPGQKQR